jgi:hypothetical protein
MTGVTPGRRPDLIFEELITLDSGGAYTSEWFDTAETFNIRVGAYFLATAGNIAVLDGMYDGNSTVRELRWQPLTTASGFVFANVEVTGRFFQFQIAGGDAGGFVATTVRRVRAD